mmetsp:Transcript_8157/g.25181  ORF Transcript_8157/g.25181 Transcript_8157/m.25181 type:complete len:236 (+) Transcript_8157:557-1264(+)
MGGVPASNFPGAVARKVVPSSVTWSIISPPPRKGGSASRRSCLPQRKPTPVGPSILWPEAAMKSTPRDRTSTRECGTDWHASSRTAQSAFCFASSTANATGVWHPKTFETWAIAIKRVRGVTRLRKCSSSTLPSSASSCANFSTTPFRSASICQGTMLAWCSKTVSTISSPSQSVSPKECARRFIASVAPFVNTISDGARAFTSLATFSRASSYASVARVASACAPRCTLALSRS